METRRKSALRKRELETQNKGSLQIEVEIKTEPILIDVNEVKFTTDEKFNIVQPELAPHSDESSAFAAPEIKSPKVFQDAPVAPVSSKATKYAQCKICCKRLKNAQTLKLHMGIHRQEKPFQCSFCPRQFSQVGPKTRHERIIHPEQHSSLISVKKFPCQWCPKMCPTESALVAHNRIHNGERPFQCGFCSQKFSMAWNMRSHEKRMHGQVSSPKDSDKLKCTQCQLMFRTNISLENHKLKDHLGEKPFKCEFCSKAFSSNRSLGFHMAAAHSEKLLPQQVDAVFQFKCEVCSKKYANKDQFVLHVMGHSGIRPFSCEYCQRQFCRKSHLEDHKLVHTNAKNKIFKCRYCPQRFTLRSSRGGHELRYHRLPASEHLNCHDSIRPPDTILMPNDSEFRCSFCYKSCACKTILQVHEELHRFETNRPLECELCACKFKTIPHKYSHVKCKHAKEIARRHPELAFECAKCFHRFKTSAELQSHVRPVSTRTSYDCEICNRKYASRLYLQKHLKSQRHLNLALLQNLPPGSKPFKCTLCSKAFSFEVGLVKHLRLCSQRIRQKSLHENREEGIIPPKEAVKVNKYSDNSL